MNFKCLGCWAFSATGAVESAGAIATGTLNSLSEQELVCMCVVYFNLNAYWSLVNKQVDCSTQLGNSGCNGGFMDGAFMYVEQNSGLCTEADYPYKGKNGRCSVCIAYSLFVFGFCSLLTYFDMYAYTSRARVLTLTLSRTSLW